jgi:ABC-type molybdate transport system substrate-binding protein
MTGAGGPVSFFGALVVQGPLESAVFPRFRASGYEVKPAFEPTVELVRRVRAGERPDVFLGTAQAVSDLAAEGILDPASRNVIVSSVVGIGVRQGTTAPDISDVPALKRALTGARSVGYSRTGASGIYFAGLLIRLGIADEVNARATVIEKGYTGETLLDGRADLAVQQISELRYVRGVDIAGPLPPPVQHVTEFAVAAGSHARDNAVARALIRLLDDATAHDAYAAAGLSGAR